MIRNLLCSILFVSSICSSASAQSPIDLTVDADKKRKAEDFNGSIAEYTQAIAINETAVKDFISKNEKHSKMTTYEIALADNGRAAEPKTEWAAPYFGRAMSEKALNNKEDALKDFETALALDWKMGEAYYERAFLKYAKDDKDNQCVDFRKGADCGFEKAKIAYEDNFCWNNSLSHYKEGSTKLNIKEYDAAIVEFDLAIKLNSDSSNIYLRRAQCYLGLNKTDKAIDDLNEAIKKDDKNLEAHYNLGLAFETLDNHQKAFDEFTKAITGNPSYYDAYVHRAATCESQTQFASAIYDYSAAIRLKPSNGDLYLKRGMLKRDALKNDMDACDDFIKASSLGCTDADDLAKDCKNPSKKKKN